MTYEVAKRETPKTAVTRIFGATLLALALMLGVRAPASAQTVCAGHAEMAKRLDKGYSEAPVAIGLSSNGGVVEVFSARDGATWSIVITRPDGLSCMVAAGEAWETLPKVALGPEA